MFSYFVFVFVAFFNNSLTMNLKISFIYLSFTLFIIFVICDLVAFRIAFHFTIFSCTLKYSILWYLSDFMVFISIIHKIFLNGNVLVAYCSSIFQISLSLFFMFSLEIVVYLIIISNH